MSIFKALWTYYRKLNSFEDKKENPVGYEAPRWNWMFFIKVH